MTECANYLIGTAVRSTATFTDINQVATDPTSIFCRVILPDETQLDYEYGVDAEIVKSGTGIFYYDAPNDQSGEWQVRWEGSGNNADVTSEDVWIVLSTDFTLP